MTNKQQLIAAITLFMVVLWGTSYVFGQLPEEHWAGFPVFLTSILGMFGSGAWANVALFRILDETDKC